MKLALKKSTIAIALLLLIAVSLSVAIGLKYFSLTEKQKENNFTVLPLTPTPDPAMETLLDTPAQDASDEIKQKHFAKVIKYAKDAGFLDITGCRGNPMVLFVEDRRPVVIKNTGGETHEIQLNKDAKYIIPANSSESYMLSFKEGPGVYGYGCDNVGKTAGFFVVRP